MKKFGPKRNLLPVPIKRFYDISAEPLFACKKNRFSFGASFFDKNECVCRKWSQKNTIKCLLIVLPLIIAFVLTGGICASVNEKINVFSKKDNDIKRSFLQNENDENTDLLVTVNEKSPLDKDFKTNLIHYMQIECDKKILKSLDSLMSSAQALGYNLELKKGFVCESVVKQNYDEKLTQLLNDGFSRVRAESAAEKLVSSPGKSEYQTGLLIDIVASNMNDSEFIASDAYKWLVVNCINYGFILRYPSDKCDKTSKDFNPFAFRFVGEYHAKKMRSLSMCLEEYSRYINAQK